MQSAISPKAASFCSTGLAYFSFFPGAGTNVDEDQTSRRLGGELTSEYGCMHHGGDDFCKISRSYGTDGD
jgi:hypothetical protein